MNWLAISLLAFASPLLEKTVVDQDMTHIDEDALQFLQGLYEKAHSKETDCLCNQTENVIRTLSTPLSFSDKTQDGSKIKIFMSFSVPIETWLDYSKELEKLNGTFVIRGLPENSFETLSKKVMEFRKNEVNAPIQIDPEAFELYGVVSVPTIILEEKSCQDKIEGNLRLSSALQMIVENGATGPFAKECLAKLIGQNVSNVGNILTNQNFSNVGKIAAMQKGG